MEMLEIPLPDSIRAFVERRAAEGGFGSAGEFVLAVLRDLRARESRREIERQVLAALQSPGDDIEVDAAFWEGLHAGE